MFPELDKSYDPQAIEPRWAQTWVDEGLYQASNRADDPRPTWSLVIPPPNVTGSLHMGHMLEHTLIDIVVRWQRMQGKNVLWLPGTDHAGIATQMVVERALAAEGIERRQLGREKFVEAVWEWKQKSGDRIREQMIRLGASCDWSRERFTLDPGLSRAVREVFVGLYEQGLIYRGRYIVNWCPRCQTAVSDLEVAHENVTGKLYEVRYPLAGRPGEFLHVATTRPETILGDVAVAVNRADPRYQALIGAEVEIPFTGRRAPVIADDIAQPEYGTGAVKITPGHDPNDFAAGERHRLEQLVVMDETAHMNAAAGAYAGLDRFEARRRIVADLEAAGLLVKVDDHAMALGKCQRCGSVIEPRISTQWFVRIAPLAAAAVAAVADGSIRFVPENNAKIYFEWMANIHDWCISRQLWWGHRIPAWYCDACGSQTLIVSREDPTACPGCGGPLRQETDVLDTWFSSGLWPFSTLGWPEATADLEKFYPTSLLITGFDILFFWVARMIMLGVHFMQAVPFREVYIHALVRDAGKQKMSKTKGNVIDPLVVTEKYGTDAVRFTLAAMAAPGTDIALAEERMAGYAAFANKIWNAARFIFLTVNRVDEQLAPEPAGAPLRPRGDHPVDWWLFQRLHATAAALHTDFEKFRFDLAAHRVYDFFWYEFCDWYLELLKPRLNGEDRTAARTAAANLVNALDAALRLLHPIMPFISEEIWRALRPDAGSIALAAFPAADPAFLAAPAAIAAASRLAALQAVVTQIRSLRSEWSIPPAKKLTATLASPEWDAAALAAVGAEIRALAGLASLQLVESIASGRLGVVSTPSLVLSIGLEGAIDVAAERERLTKERDTLGKGIRNAEGLLASDSFRARAKAEVVADTERKLRELTQQRERVEASLHALDQLG